MRSSFLPLLAFCVLTLTSTTAAIRQRTTTTIPSHNRYRTKVLPHHTLRGHNRVFKGAEAPFVQQVSKRFVVPGSKGDSATGWGVLPFQRAPFATSASNETTLWVAAEASPNVVSVFAMLSNGTAVPLSTFRSFEISAMTTIPVSQPNVNTSVIIAGPSLLLALMCPEVLSGGGCTVLSEIPLTFVNVTSVVFSPKDSTVYLGTNLGLYEGAFSETSGVGSVSASSMNITYPVNTLALSENGALAIGTAPALYIANLASKTVEHHWTQQLIDANVTAVGFGVTGSLWIGNEYCVNVLLPNGQFQRLGGRAGLPYGNITSIAQGYTDHETYSEMWLGTRRGAILARVDLSLSSPHHLAIANWSFYSGPRWHSGVEVTDIAYLTRSDGVPAVWMRTDVGLSRISRETWTYTQKAAVYEGIVQARHDRFGMVSDSRLKVFGDLSSNELVDSDNDGSWTSYYGVAESLRYAVTKDPDAYKYAVRSFEAMEFLNNVTGVPGFVARSVLKEGTAPVSGNPWFNSTVYPGWKYKGNTSSDEITCHWWLYPIFRDLVADTPSLKERANRLITNIVTYLMKNDYNLRSPNTGEPTRWGVWNPNSLNNDPYWSDERGLNSNELLGGMLAAIRAAPNATEYQAGLEYLIGQGFLNNIKNVKITAVNNIDHSDDHLAFVSYMTYLWCTDNATLTEPMKLGMNRSWEYIKQEHGSFFNWIYSHASPSSFDREGGLWLLQNWPLETVDWTFTNSIRTDLPYNPEPAIRQDNSVNEGMKPYPPDEGDFFRWSHNPYHPDGGSGMREYDPSAWLMAYWLGRYLNIIGPDA